MTGVASKVGLHRSLECPQKPSLRAQALTRYHFRTYTSSSVPTSPCKRRTISDKSPTGNDPDQDPELRTPDVPVAPIDKPAARSGKRNAAPEAPVSAPAQTGGDRGDRGGRGRGRGGRGGRGGRDGNDQGTTGNPLMAKQ